MLSSVGFGPHPMAGEGLQGGPDAQAEPGHFCLMKGDLLGRWRWVPGCEPLLVLGPALRGVSLPVMYKGSVEDPPPLCTVIAARGDRLSSFPAWATEQTCQCHWVVAAPLCPPLKARPQLSAAPGQEGWVGTTVPCLHPGLYGLLAPKERKSVASGTRPVGSWQEKEAAPHSLSSQALRVHGLGLGWLLGGWQSLTSAP